ncbi:hypothetical protein N7462_006834 [Penicillium macrosclerotiorum]|uniref:uncharacterized protein n=1 Tax=Penicillium macrosclerotiorum TaxID=303699 RepID=UPI00254722F4|nr:uncharacterized protein N7462_006834 [Penicillium macrosclerotiorum]KAJ5678590.1 hypothetical protein N7462_006834 [Penicillium macrosclerotiorum]
MSSSILHQCPFCGHLSDISLALAAFLENPHCNQCGLSVSESHGKLQDDLSALFDRQMTMGSLLPPPEQTPAATQTPISYISQHYHHSSHVVAPNPGPAPLSTSVETEDSAVHDVLRQCGLDPNAFSVNQLDLFKNADAEQQKRLVQTWQVYSVHENSTLTQDMEMNDSTNDQKDAEPYMMSGYEIIPEPTAKSPPNEPTTGEPYAASTDPVYKSPQWWETGQTGPMESQYGIFEERNRYFLTHCSVAHSHY